MSPKSSKNHKHELKGDPEVIQIIQKKCKTRTQKNQRIYYGLGTSTPPLSETLAIKNACRNRLAVAASISLFFLDVAEFWMPWEGFTNQLVDHFFDSAPLGGPLGGPGPPNDTKIYQNDTNIM